MVRMTEAFCCASCTLLVALAIVVWAVFFDEIQEAEAEVEDGGSASGSSDDWRKVTVDDVTLDPYVALIGIPCTLAVCFLIFAASREGGQGSSESVEEHHSIGMWMPRTKRVPGPVGGKGKDDMKEILLRGLQYLQLSAAAFSARVPWSLKANATKFLSFWALDVDVLLPETDYTRSVCLSAGVALVWTGLLIAADQRPSACGGPDVANAIKRVAGLLIVPFSRVWGDVYFGCTFYANDRPSTFDADPQVSCFEGRWWLYAIVALVPCWFTFKSLHVEATRLSDSTIFSHQKSSYPVATSFAYAFTISMVATTLVDVAFSKWHPLFSNMLVAVVHGVLALWLLLLRPYMHTWMNRFCCYGQLHEVVSYVGAYVAVHIDDSGSTDSGRMFTRGELFLGILFVLAEIVCFFIEKGTTSHWHPTLVPVPERQTGGSLFRLGMALLGIHDDQGEEEDEEHGEERKSSIKPKTEEKKAKTNSKTKKKRTKKTQSDNDNPQVAKLEDKVAELEVRMQSKCLPHRHALAYELMQCRRSSHACMPTFSLVFMASSCSCAHRFRLGAGGDRETGT